MCSAMEPAILPDYKNEISMLILRLNDPIHGGYTAKL